MKSFLTILSLLLLFPIASPVANAQTISGRSIAEKVYNRPDGNTSYSELTLTLINKNNSRRVRKVGLYSKKFGNGGDDKKRLVFFLYPGDVKGTGFLTYDYDEIGKEDDRWLYLPALKSTRRISGASSKKDYFMGTDFTYEDLGSRNVDEDKHKLLREQVLGGKKCWVLESVPVTKGEIYSKRIWWVRQDCLLAVKAEFYDKSGNLHRIFEASDIKKVDGIWTPGKLEACNVQTGHKTVIIYTNLRYNTTLDDNLFTVSSLSRGL